MFPAVVTSGFGSAYMEGQVCSMFHNEASLTRDDFMVTMSIFFRCSFHKSSLSDKFTYLLVFLARYPSYVCVTLLPSNKWRFCYSAARVLRGMPVFVVRSWENVSTVSVYCHWDPEMLEGWHHLSSLPNLLSSNNISWASRDMWLYSEAR